MRRLHARRQLRVGSTVSDFASGRSRIMHGGGAGGPPSLIAVSVRAASLLASAEVGFRPPCISGSRAHLLASSSPICKTVASPTLADASFLSSRRDRRVRDRLIPRHLQLSSRSLDAFQICFYLHVELQDAETAPRRRRRHARVPPLHAGGGRRDGRAADLRARHQRPPRALRGRPGVPQAPGALRAGGAPAVARAADGRGERQARPLARRLPPRALAALSRGRGAQGPRVFNLAVRRARAQRRRGGALRAAVPRHALVRARRPAPPPRRRRVGVGGARRQARGGGAARPRRRRRALPKGREPPPRAVRARRRGGRRHAARARAASPSRPSSCSSSSAEAAAAAVSSKPESLQEVVSHLSRVLSADAPRAAQQAGCMLVAQLGARLPLSPQISIALAERVCLCLVGGAAPTEALCALAVLRRRRLLTKLPHWALASDGAPCSWLAPCAALADKADITLLLPALVARLASVDADALCRRRRRRRARRRRAALPPLGAAGGAAAPPPRAAVRAPRRRRRGRRRVVCDARRPTAGDGGAAARAAGGAPPRLDHPSAAVRLLAVQAMHELGADATVAALAKAAGVGRAALLGCVRRRLSDCAPVAAAIVALPSLPSSSLLSAAGGVSGPSSCAPPPPGARRPRTPRGRRRCGRTRRRGRAAPRAALPLPLIQQAVDAADAAAAAAASADDADGGADDAAARRRAGKRPVAAPTAAPTTRAARRCARWLRSSSSDALALCGLLMRPEVAPAAALRVLCAWFDARGRRRRPRRTSGLSWRRLRPSSNASRCGRPREARSRRRSSPRSGCCCGGCPARARRRRRRRERRRRGVQRLSAVRRASSCSGCRRARWRPCARSSRFGRGRGSRYAWHRVGPSARRRRPPLWQSCCCRLRRPTPPRTPAAARVGGGASASALSSSRAVRSARSPPPRRRRRRRRRRSPSAARASSPCCST